MDIDNIKVDLGLVDAFHLMYDSFPECVQLTHKSKTIIAINPAGQTSGKNVGMVCARLGPPEGHKGCLASKALNLNKPMWVTINGSKTSGHQSVAFWLPIAGHPDFYIHFACGNTIDYSVPPQR